jgi:copper transport protein
MGVPGGTVRARTVQCLVIVAGLLITLGLSVFLADSAQAQGLHGEHAGGSTGRQQELLGRVGHGLTLAATAFLAGLAPFAALVWLPASRESGAGRDAIRGFAILAWLLFYVLAVAGVGELSAYAIRASGEPLSVDLFREALLDTRVGTVWLARLGFGVLTAVAITAAVRLGWVSLWWAAAAIGSLLLMTLTQLSHAAAEGRFLPFLADWVHTMAAAIWMGGLLGFTVTISSGSLGDLEADRRANLREHSVRRFSTVAMTAVLVLASTGLYAVLLHVPNFEALVATAYGRSLLVKLGFLMFVIAIGAANFLLRGRGPFGRLVLVELFFAFGLLIATGFLTSIPPPDAT